MRTYHIFISHSWKYDKHRERIVKFLDDSTLKCKDYSVPPNDPIHTGGTDKDLREAIDRKIKPCSIVIVLAGVYATYSKWIKEEIAIAQRYNKPILAVEYWGSERTSIPVKEAANKIVKWQENSIADAIKKLCE